METPIFTKQQQMTRYIVNNLPQLLTEMKQWEEDGRMEASLDTSWEFSSLFADYYNAGPQSILINFTKTYFNECISPTPFAEAYKVIDGVVREYLTVSMKLNIDMASAINDLLQVLDENQPEQFPGYRQMFLNGIAIPAAQEALEHYNRLRDSISN